MVTEALSLGALDAMDDSLETLLSRRGIFDDDPSLDLLDSEGFSDAWRSPPSFPLPLASHEAVLLALKPLRFMADLIDVEPEPLGSGLFTDIERVIGENPCRNEALRFLFGGRTTLEALGGLSSSSVSSSNSSSGGICTWGAIGRGRIRLGLTIRIEGSPSTDFPKAAVLAPLVDEEVEGLAAGAVGL
jgi:hypothetical protein